MKTIFLTTLFIGSFVLTQAETVPDELLSSIPNILKPWKLAGNPPKIGDFEHVVIDSSPGWNGIDNSLDDDEDDDAEDNLDDYRKPEKIDDLTLIETVPTADHDIVEDSIMTTPELARKYGYEVEVHTIMNSDGYYLEMHRLPGKKSWPLPKKRQPVFLMHGILDSSASWLLMGPGKGLGYLLSDLGYDVWMGNARGNRYSRSHLTYNPDGKRKDRKKFWSFSWHEIGNVDVPEMIDFVLNTTGYEKLHYIGHSQGTTSFFVMASERPEYNDKILSMHALAPIAFMKDMRSPFIRAATVFLNTLDVLTGMMGVYEFLPTSELMQIGGQLVCKDEAFTQALCSNVLFLICGYNSEQLNTTMVPVILSHIPAGSSTNQLVHYGQLHKSGKFRQYDWGMVSNLGTYGQMKPPNYDLKKITAPVALHYSSNDWLAEPTDVEKLHKQLPNVIGSFLVRDPKFNHLDFLFAIDVKELLYNRIFNLMRLVEQGELPL